MVSPRAGSLTIGIRHLGNPTFGMQFMNDTETVPRDLATQQEPCKPYYTDLMEEKLPALLILQLSHRFWLLLGWEATKTHSLGLAPFPVCAPLAKEANHTGLRGPAIMYGPALRDLYFFLSQSSPSGCPHI